VQKLWKGTETRFTPDCKDLCKTSIVPSWLGGICGTVPTPAPTPAPGITPAPTTESPGPPTPTPPPTTPPTAALQCQSGTVYDPACKQYPDTAPDFVSHACPKDKPFLYPASLHCHADFNSAYICCYGSTPSAAPTTAMPTRTLAPTWTLTTAAPTTDKMAGAVPFGCP
jgi:hypothetical protein